DCLLKCFNVFHTSRVPLLQWYVKYIIAQASAAREGGSAAEEVDCGGAAGGLPAESQDPGGVGHHADLGQGGGEGHLQSAGGRDRTTGVSVGGSGRGEGSTSSVGGAARVESLFWQQPERRGGD